MTTSIIPFAYDDDAERTFCEAAAVEIRRFSRTIVRDAITMGQKLNEVKHCLRGRFLSWLDSNGLFGYSADVAERWMKLGAVAIQIPQIAEFPTVEAAMYFVDLPANVQRAILDRQAFCRMRELEQVAHVVAIQLEIDEAHALPPGKERDNLMGNAYQAIQTDLANPDMAKDVGAIYETYREEFADLSGRTPPEVDIEVGWKRPPVIATPTANGEKPTLQDVETDEGHYWLCEASVGECAHRIELHTNSEGHIHAVCSICGMMWTASQIALLLAAAKFVPVAPIPIYTVVYPGRTIIAAWPSVDANGSGPIAQATQNAARAAIGGRTLEQAYGKVKS